MKIRFILFATILILIGTVSPVVAQRVQIAIGNPGCGPGVYGRPAYYQRPVFVGSPAFCRPAPVVIVRPARTVYLSSSPMVVGQSPVVIAQPSRLGVYRAPMVPVNAVRNGNGFTWRR